jgi:hypothetical protein
LPENNSSPTAAQLQSAKALASETGISERQALELVELLGVNNPSLAFHARELKRGGEIV